MLSLHPLLQMNNSRAWKSSSIILSQMVVACMAALLLLWGLGTPYLWQDEAATAVLAQRMLRLGRPLAYDGVNLITIDHWAAEEKATIDQRTRDPQAAINYYVRRGDMKADTAWIWQPWGQFVVAALSFKTLGATTLAARLPFALASIATVLILYRFVLTYFEHAQMALLASVFLVFNAYWILHSRQCRYYSLSSLFLVLTLASYARWQWGGRWGAALFVITAWCWFQVDYGTVWPALGVLFADAVVAQRRSLWRPTLVGGVLGAAIAPFAYYYELWGRHSIPASPWHERFMRNLLNVNEYVVPVLIVGVAIAVSVHRRKTLPVAERRLVVIACAIFVVLLFWVPAVAPGPLLRYVIIMAPVGCLLVAWVLVRLGGSQPRVFTWAAAAMFLLTPWLSLPLSLPLHVMHRAKYRGATVFRFELEVLRRSVFGHRADPNRLVADWLKQNAAADDEILINYEDIPLMFYLPNPIRGGVAAFRVEDDAKRPPDFVVLRHSVAEFGHWPVYDREVQRYAWTPVPLQAPDVHWGNCPDPIAQEEDPAHAQSIYIARRVVGQGTPVP